MPCTQGSLIELYYPALLIIVFELINKETNKLTAVFEKMHINIERSC